MNQAILQNTPELKIAICEDNPLHLSESHRLLQQNSGDAAPVFSLDDKKAKEIMDAIVKEYRQYRKLIFREWDTVHFVNIADILYMEAREKCTFAYTVSQEFSSKTSLNEYDALLKQNGFFRIHRKYLVNSYYVDKLTAGGLTLSRGIELPVARRQRADFKKLFLNAMERGYF